MHPTLKSKRESTGLAPGERVQLRENPGGSGGAPAGDAPGRSLNTDLRDAHPVRCAACGHEIARPSDRTDIDGRHAHEFLNPAGITFRVGCFRDAPGCVAVGERSTVWSWFPGFAWQVVLCARCHAHLGWGFSATDDITRFFALILDRLCT